MKKIKKIVYVSGTRADFGLMSHVLEKISQSQKLELQLYVTGMHLMKEFGYTVDTVKSQFSKVKILDAFFKDDKKKSIINFYAKLLLELNTAFAKNAPDFVLTLGDRPEMLAVSSACAYLGIPSGQLHAGDRSRTVDEMVRHAITKLSHLLFPATVDAAKRIEKMGEEKWRIHMVGAPAIDAIKNSQLLTRQEVLGLLRLKKDSQYILFTWHPAIEEKDLIKEQTEALIKSIKFFKMPVVVIYPNSDPGSADIISVIEHEINNPQFRLIKNIKQDIFFALEKETCVWVGNSSAGIIESASFGTPVVNVGLRQQGRLHTQNVIDTPMSEEAIKNSIKKCLFDQRFRQKLKNIKNPWGDGKTGEKIVDLLEKLEINDKLRCKQIIY